MQKLKIGCTGATYFANVKRVICADLEAYLMQFKA